MPNGLPFSFCARSLRSVQAKEKSVKPPYYELREKQIAEAFRLFAEARRDLTLMEFERHIRRSLTELGGKGFVQSIGEAITKATIE